jgi:drug/metabolite transporter (DMT)-like permease
MTGLVISLAGVVWVITQGEPGRLLQFNLNPGDLIILAAVTCWALYSVLLKKLRPTGLSALPFLAVQFLIGLVFIFPFYAYEQAQLSPLVWGIETWMILAYVGLFPSLIAYFYWQQGIAMGGANIAGFIYPLISVFTVVIAYVFLGESLNSAQFVGAILVITGVILALSNSLSLRVD